jgi:hypothetical protein
MSNPMQPMQFQTRARGNDITQQVRSLQQEVAALKRAQANASRALGFDLEQPTLPASGVMTTNDHYKPVVVYVRGGTVTAVNIDGTGLSLAGGTFWLPPKATITVTYSVAPTWHWYGT